MTAPWVGAGWASVVRRGSGAAERIAGRASLRVAALAGDRLAILSLVVGVASGTWVAALLLRRVDSLSAPPYDLAFFQQVIWNVGHTGRWVSGFNEGSFLGLHFSPLLVVPALVERLVWPDVRVLNLFHAVAVGTLVPATFLFLRAAMRPAKVARVLAAALACSVPAWASMQEVIRADFHPETAGVALALLAGWAGLTRRLPAMWLLAGAALLTREDLAYAIGVVGLLVAARGRGTVRRHGWLLAGGAVAWGALVFGLLMPWLRAGAVSDTASYYAWLGGGFGVLTAPFTETNLVVAAIARPAPWFVVLGLLVAVVGLPLLRPRWLVLLLPPLLASLLSSHVWQANLLLQYPLILVVPLLAATAMGGRRAIAVNDRLGRLARRRSRGRSHSAGGRLLDSTATPRTRPGQRSSFSGALGLAALVALPGLAGASAQGSVPPFDEDVAFVARPAGVDRLEHVAGLVPPDAVLVVDSGLVAPLAGRTTIVRLTAYPMPLAGGYVILDRDAWSPTPDAARQHERVLVALEASARPRLVDDGRFVVWGPEQEAAR
jgi:uncharacterized membrane protein